MRLGSISWKGLPIAAAQGVGPPTFKGVHIKQMRVWPHADEELAAVETELKGVIEALIKGAQKGSATAKTALSPTSLVSLRMAQHALALARA